MIATVYQVSNQCRIDQASHSPQQWVDPSSAFKRDRTFAPATRLEPFSLSERKVAIQIPWKTVL